MIVDGGSRDDTVAVAERHGARIVTQAQPGYGAGFREGVAACAGEWIATLDADLSHDPRVVLDLMRARPGVDLVVASRYVPFGHANMPLARRLLSRVLNRVYGIALDLPVRDLSSGFRLYRATALRATPLHSRDFDVLPEALVGAYAAGYAVREVPFHYWPRGAGRSHAKLFRFGISYLRTLARLWRVRNTFAAADYDYRAFHSRLPVQRWWQRRRYRLVTRFTGAYTRGLDIGCGSSPILGALPRTIGVDLSLARLRFLRNHGRPELIRADATRLPFPDACCDLVVASQVIQYVAEPERLLAECARVLAPGGTLVLGFPDHDAPAWRLLGWLHARLTPGACEGRPLGSRSLAPLLADRGFALDGAASILGAERVLRLRRRATPR